MEEQKKPADQHNKRQRVSENAESSNKKPSHLNGLKVHLGRPVGVALSPGVTGTRPPAAPSPVAKAKPIAVVKPTAATVAVTGPVATMAPAPAPAAPSPVDMKTPTPAAPSPVVTMAPAPPSPVATMTPAQAPPSPVATKTPALAAPSPVATATPVAVVNPPATVKHEPEDGGVLEVDEQAARAMVAVAPAEEEAVILEVKKKWLHCAACPAPLKRPIFMCGDGHVVCCACGGGGNGNGDGGANKHCDLCGRATTYTRIPYMEGLVDAYKVPCPYRNFGCARSVAYHSAADHPSRCAHAPCYCLECPFQGSPASLLRHLTEESGRHCWPMEKIKYQICRPLVVPASEHRLLLVAEEDGRVFLLAVGPGRGAAGVCPVTVVCVRGNVDARPLYTGVLWVDGPPAAAGHLRSSFQLKGDVANCGVPGEVDMEHGRLHAHVNPEMLHGESKEIHLRICITKFW